MSALTTGSPLLDVYRLARLIGEAQAQCPVLVGELADALALLDAAETTSERMFAEARVEGCEEALVAECAALRQAAGLGAAR